MHDAKLTVKVLLFWLLHAAIQVAALAPAAAAEPPKLAIIAEAPELKNLADVLTVQWSLKGGVTLLERADLEKVLSEQTLTAGGQKNFIKLGQLLGADGLIILETAKAGTNSLLATRLVAVSPGVVLDIKGFPLPVRDFEGWSEFMVQNHTPLLPKLKVPRSAAVPVSILNLRASLDSPANRDIERQLTALTADRLVQQHEFFVLERQRMSQLTWEKTLKGVDEAPFWTGSFLLEGTLDKNGFDPQVLTVSAHLAPAQGGASVPIEISSARTNLAGVVDELSKKVSEVILKSSNWSPWNAKAEADKYYEEANWAVRWQLQEKAEQAIDAAWALGRRDGSTASRRVDIYQSGANSNFQLHWVNKLRVDSGRPEGKHLYCAIQTLNIYSDNFRRQEELAGLVTTELLNQGLTTLETCSSLLEHFRFVVRAQRGNETGLEELQRLCREQNQQLESALADTRLPADISESMRKRLYSLQFRYCCCWFPTLDQVWKYYRGLLMSEHYPVCRKQVLMERDVRLVSWRYEDLAITGRRWDEIVDELCRSDDFRLRCEGQLLRLRDLNSGESLDGTSTMSGSFSSASKEMEAALSQQVDAVLRLFWDSAKEEYAAQAGVDLINALEELILRKCSGWKMPIKETLRKEQEIRKFGRFKHYLRTATMHEANRFSALETSSRAFAFEVTPVRARVLLPLLYDYQQRFPNGDWVKSIVAMVEKKSECSADELREWLQQAGAADYTALPALVGGKVFGEAEATQLRPLFEAYKLRVPAAASIVDQLLRTQVQTVASRMVTTRTATENEERLKKQNHVRIYNKLMLVLENGEAFDAELIFAGLNPVFSREESRVLLELLQKNRGKSQAHPQQLGMLEVWLRKTAFTLDDLLEYLRAAQQEDEDILKPFFFDSRILSPEEAEIVMPAWQHYKRRMPDNPKLHRVVEFKLDLALKRKVKQ
jgi:hypothetical protein